MSAAASLASLGTGTKNLAIGIAVIAGVAAVVYLAFKGKQAAAAVGQAAKDAGGYLFGSDYASSTIGSDLYDLLNPAPTGADGKPSYWDADQAERTRIALIAAREKTYGVD